MQSCLKDERNTDILNQGRKALQKHQDSFSDRPKRKKEKSKEQDPEIVTREKKKRSPISLVLKEFINLDLSEEEEQHEEAAARSERERGSWRQGNDDVFMKGNGRLEAPVASASPPSAPPPMYSLVATEGYSFIGRQTWLCLPCF